MTQERGSTFARRAIRAALTGGVYFLIGLGPTLVMLPVIDGITPETNLLTLKFISVMGGTAVVVSAGMAAWLLGAVLRRVVLKLRQADHDHVALDIMRDLRANTAARVPEFYLYLRAFETTGRLHVPLFLRLRKISIGLNHLVTNDVESYVSDAIRKVAPLVALGSTGEAIGAGRIVTDDEHWKADIRVLMDRAKAILLVPSDRPGTVWEVETLKSSGLLHKVIFIMPPRSKGALDTRERWEAARQALAARGLDAPDHQKRGLLFVVDAHGKVSNVEPLLLTSSRKVRKSLKRLLVADQAAGGFFKAVASAERRSRRAIFWGWSETLRQLSPYALAIFGLLAPRHDAGFDPRESWSVIFDRFGTTSEIAQYRQTDPTDASEAYRALEAQVPREKRDAWRDNLTHLGLARLDDEQLRAFDVALAELLARLDTKTCAGFVRRELSPQARAVALSYIPSEHVRGYLHAESAAMLAAVEQRGIAAADAGAVDAAMDQFVSHLAPDGQQRLQKIAQATPPLSDDDVCWRARVVMNAVATLPQPHAIVLARYVAISELPAGEVIADAGKTAAPSPQPQPERPAKAAPAVAAVPAPQPRVAGPAVRHDAEPTVARTPTPEPRPSSVPTADGPTASVDRSPKPPAAAVPEAPPRLTYPQLLEGATLALGAGQFGPASDLIDQLLRLDPSRAEGWSLRGALALNGYGDLGAARGSFENALARGGRAAFRVIHDHGGNQTPCGGTLYVTPLGVDYTPASGDHHFHWSYLTIREAAINGVYGSQYGMFHVKADEHDKVGNFNFVVVRVTDEKLVNRRADAELLLSLINRRRTSK